MNLIWIFWLLIALVPGVYLYFQWKFSYWKRKGVPYMKPRFPLGTIGLVKGGHIKDSLAEFYKRKGEFLFIGGYTLFKPAIVAVDLDFIQNILIRNFNQFVDRGIFHNEEDDPLSAGLFFLDGPKWKTLRTKLSPTFTSGRMKFMFPTVVEVSERLRETLNHLTQTEKTVEIKDLLARFTMDIIGTCAFGIECNTLNDPNTDFRKYGRKHAEQPRNTSVISGLIGAFPEIAKKLHFKRIHDDVAEFFMGIVRDTIDYREKNNIRRNDFMDLLIQLKNNAKLEDDDSIVGKLTFNEIAAQAFIFFVAGFETSASTMSYALYELSLNQDVQERCRQEINRVLDKHEGKLTYEAMVEMTYIEQTLLETLRKYPIFPLLARNSVSDYKVPGTNITIEKGIQIQVPIYAIQHDPAYYPNPEKFDPDRFSPENVKSRHPMAFLSFGDGPRNCIGLRFGKLQSRVGLIMLLKNYRFKLSPKTSGRLEFMPSFLLKPKGTIFVELERICDNNIE